MFKSNNKNTRTMSLTSFFVNFEHISQLFSIGDFKQVNVSWNQSLINGTNLLRENVTKAMAYSMDISPILTC